VIDPVRDRSPQAIVAVPLAGRSLTGLTPFKFHVGLFYMKKILVTGGAGFIGSHLCEYLLAQGEYVICVDNLFTGNKKNIANLLANDNFSFLEHDIVEPLYIDEPIDQVYNLACPAAPIHYQLDPIHTVKANTAGVINMLGLAKKHKAKILQASTSEVYGDPNEHPQKETYWGNVNPIGPRACYDEGKRVAETLFFDYHQQDHVQIRVARIFNTYGPRMAYNDGRMIPNFVTQALQGKDLTIYGDGEQTRSVCYVTDLVDGLYKLMNQHNFIGPVNIGNPDEYTVKQLAEKVLAATKSDSKLVYQPLPQDDPKQRRPDISLAKEKLQWQPSISLEEGLAKTIEYYKEILS
jgi:UDP-glucuronate decarboxylase